MGHDRFIFTTNPDDTQRISGRIDDFDISRDTLWLDGEKIDLFNPGPRVRIVQQYSQPWILIDNRILYALEGARFYSDVNDPDTDGDGENVPTGDVNSDEERHFLWPKAWENGVPASYDVPYMDLMAYFPADRVDGHEGKMAQVHGGAGHDTLHGTDIQERLVGFAGDDTIYGNGGDDLIHGAEGRDVIYGGDGDDSISGGLDDDIIHGGQGRDIIYGGSGNDTVHGDDGNDELRGNNGNDVIHGGKGADTLIGGWNRDQLFGGDGNDVLYASIPREEGIMPYSELDTLDGGNGQDTMHAGENGATTMIGGAGNDLMYAAKDNMLFLADFKPGEDILDLSYIDKAPEDLLGSLRYHERFEGMETGGLMLSLTTSGMVMFQGLVEEDMKAVIASITIPDTIERTGPVESIPWKPGGSNNDKKDDEDDEDQARKDAEEEEQSGAAAAGGGGCFVATACFGGAAHPDVDWLRRFRTRVLMPNAPGRLFCRTYYRVGPWLAHLVRHDMASGRMMRAFLGGLVRLGRRSFPEV